MCGNQKWSDIVPARLHASMSRTAWARLMGIAPEHRARARAGQLRARRLRQRFERLPGAAVAGGCLRG